MNASHTSTQAMRALFTLLRPHQWSKNLLVFVPLLSAHLWMDSIAIGHSVLVFIAFCLASSSIYVVNDAVDVENDRQHPTKKHRPFASGALPPRMAFWLTPMLILVAVAITFTLPEPARWLIAIYLTLSLSYCFILKPLLWLDVLTLAALYTLRVLAGAAAIAVPVSPWLAGFSLFMFFGLAAVKRYGELRATKASNLSGRGYTAEDALPVICLGSGSTMVSIMVLSLYLNSENVHELYRQEEWLWLVGPTLLYWQSRLWTLAHRGVITRDPLSFALRDGVSWACAGVCLVLFSLAI